MLACLKWRISETWLWRLNRGPHKADADQAKLCKGENHRDAGKTVPVPQASGSCFVFWDVLRFKDILKMQNAGV